MSLLRRRMMMASSVKEPDVPDTPTEELDYLTIIPLHEEEEWYYIYPYADYYHVLPFYYRINKGEWVEVNLSGTSTPVFCINLNKTKELQLKCNSVEFDPELINIQNFSISSIGSFSLGGTPMSIIYGDDFNDYDYVPDSFLVSMFANNSGLKSIVNPETFLPYTNVSGSCYVSLFEGCTSLTNSPTLPATTLTYDCYAMMFRGCSNLKHIKMLAKEAKSTSGISIGIEDCLYDWVEGVSSTGTFVKHPDMTSLPTGVDGIPKGWTVVNDGEGNGSEWAYEKHFVFELEYDEHEGWTYIESGDFSEIFLFTKRMVETIGTKNPEGWWSIYSLDYPPEEFNITYNGEKVTYASFTMGDMVVMTTESYYVELNETGLWIYE